MANHSSAEAHHYHPDMWVFPDAREVTRDVTGKTRAMPSAFKVVLVVSGLLAVLGVVGFIARASLDGFVDHAPWGYYAAIFSFIFLVTGAAPLVAVALRLTKNHWRRPISRIAELFAVVGVVNVILFIPLMMVYPPILNPGFGPDVHGQVEVRRTLWFEVPIGAPHWWDMLGLVALAVTALAILWVSAMPDMAEARAGSTGFRRFKYNLLAGAWRGSKRQWVWQRASLALLGALYFLMLVFVQFLIVTDYAMSMIPGYKDAILPPLYTVTGFQSAISVVLVIAFVLRRWGGYRDYIGLSPFWSASKVQLGLTLLWTYHLFAFFITYWYGRLEVEQNILRYLLFESYGGIFWANLLLIFFIPFFLLVLNPVRKTDWGPALAGLLILTGNLLFNIRLFVASFNVGEIYELFLTRVPPPVFPDIWDVFMVMGGLGLVAFIYLLASRVVPIISMWEIKEGALYQRKDRLFRGEYLVLAKPE